MRNGIVSVMLAGGNEAVQERIDRMLSNQEEVIVISKLRDEREVLDKTALLSPDIVILMTDDDKPGTSVIESARAISNAKLPTRSIIMTDNVARDLVPAIKSGAACLVSKSISRDELLSAILIPSQTGINNVPGLYPER